MVRLIIARCGQTWIDFFRHLDATVWSDSWKTQITRFGQTPAKLDSLTQHGCSQSVQLGESVYDTQLHSNSNSALNYPLNVHSIGWFSSKRASCQKTVQGAMRGFRACSLIHRTYFDLDAYSSKHLYDIDEPSVEQVAGFDKQLTLESLVAPSADVSLSDAKQTLAFYTRHFLEDESQFLSKSLTKYISHVRVEPTHSKQTEFLYDFQRLVRICHPRISSLLHTQISTQVRAELQTLANTLQDRALDTGLLVTDDQTVQTLYQTLYAPSPFIPSVSNTICPSGFFTVDVRADNCVIQTVKPVHSYGFPKLTTLSK
jgi:hypothetical protein